MTPKAILTRIIHGNFISQLQYCLCYFSNGMCSIYLSLFPILSFYTFKKKPISSHKNDMQMTKHAKMSHNHLHSFIVSFHKNSCEIQLLLPFSAQIHRRNDLEAQGVSKGKYSCMGVTEDVMLLSQTA